MRVSLSTPTFDLDGYVILDVLPSSDVDSLERRVSRVRTLDGGVAYDDAGFAHGDRTLNVSWRIRDAAQYEAVRRLVREYSELHVSLSDGCYACSPSRVSRSGTEGRIDLMVLRSLS